METPFERRMAAACLVTSFTPLPLPDFQSAPCLTPDHPQIGEVSP